jgi:hypothetical protein
MRTLDVSAREFLQQALLPVLVPASLMVMLLYGLMWILEPSSFVAVGCTAMAALITYTVVYTSFFIGSAERELFLGVIAKLAGGGS